MSKLKEALDFLDSEDEKERAAAWRRPEGAALSTERFRFWIMPAPVTPTPPARYAPADNANTAYQQYAKEYAQYGSQYQRQLVQGKTGRQWAADVNKRL